MSEQNETNETPGRIGYEIDEARGLIIERASGAVSFEGADAYVAARSADPRYAATRRGILDLRGATVEFDGPGMAAIRDFYRRNRASIIPPRWAILADSPREVALVTLLQEVWREIGLEVEIFSTEERAFEYLQLD